MLIVSGSLWVDPGAREHYLVGCREAVELARVADGCLDYALSADLIDDGRINVYERWESDEQLMAFRGSGPDDEQTTAINDADVKGYRISAVEDA